MIPLKDYNPTERFPLVTIVLIALNVFVYLFVQRPAANDGGRFTYAYAAIPCEIVQGEPLTRRELAREDQNGCDRAHPPTQSGLAQSDFSPQPFADKNIYLAVLFSMFLHGSVLHIASNMLFLWVFGNNIEDRMGAVGYVAFYLAAGVIATAAHVITQPNSTVPVVGASGAIAGVMGAYLVLFPNVKIRSVLIYFLVLIRDIPAKWLLGFWFVLQFFTSPTEGVAWVAHVGGFVFGALVALALRDRLLPNDVSSAGLSPES